ncbi:MAG: hypothetical protein EA367_16565 [Leptolyngbya sp. DLM2.Bin15]|nr:MAG: hypothetical protein EA367_16565 [Leptolyngbya sp. DLM2.Bin15]
MQSQDSVTQMTVYYLDGSSESFNIFDAIAGLDAEEQNPAIDLEQLLQQPLWVFHLPDQTVMIRSETVLKVEVKPPLFHIQGAGVINNSDRVTALTRMR